MANWSAITIDDLKASVHGAIVDAAQTTYVGSAPDPVARAIAEVTARIRASISPGNVLDADVTKIPNSLKDLAARMSVRFLKQRIQMDMTQDERDQRKEDNDYLTILRKEQTAFELADNPAGSAEMQEGGGDQIEQTTGGNLDVKFVKGPQALVATRKTLDAL